MRAQRTASTAMTADETRRRLMIFVWNASVILILLAVAFSFRDLRWGVVWDSRKLILDGLANSWLLALISVALGMAAGIPLAVARLYGPSGVRHAAVALIEAVRATPQLMLIFWVFFTYPIFTGHDVSPWGAGVISLFLIGAAYLAEVVRGGLVSVARGQFEAAQSTGLSALQSFIHIVLPQALRNMVPAFVAQIVSLFKTTSLVYVVGLVDFFRAIIIVNNANFAPYELYTTMAVGYFVCCYLLSWTIRKIDPKYVLSE